MFAESVTAKGAAGTQAATIGGSTASCVPRGYVGADIGPKTCSAFAAALKGCKSILWNGPLGMSEADAFSSGTEEVAFTIAQQARGGAAVIVGGASRPACAALLTMSAFGACAACPMLTYWVKWRMWC